MTRLTIGSDPDDFRLALNSVSDYAIFLLDPEGHVASWNLGAERLKGYKPDEIIGRHFSQFYPREAIDSGFPQKELEVAARDGRFEDEGWRVRKDGSQFWANVVVTAVIDGAGDLRGYTKVTRDLTERMLTEQALRRSERRLRRMFESEIIGVFFWELDGAITDANDALLRLVGYGREQLNQGQLRWEKLSPASFAGRSTRTIPQVIREEFGRAVESEFVCSDGAVVHVLVSSSAFDDTGECGVAFVVDISDRKQYEAELWRARNELETRVVERTQELRLANAQLHEAKETADAASRAKSEFLSRMSHELRTPMNAILGFGQLLATQDLGVTNASNLHHILKAGEHLLSLINEVLDIAQVESGWMSLSLEPVSVPLVINETLSLVRPLAEQRGVTLTLSSSLYDGYVLADNQRFKQVLMNLLSNAIKYNRVGGKVFISSTFSQERVRIAVMDTGHGMAPEDLPKLFTPFERLGAANSEIQGTGLGLALTKRMMEAMEGSVEVESALDVGSTFYLELRKADKPQSLVSSEPKWISKESPAREKAFTILAIEDNVTNYALLEAVFTERPNIKLLSAIQGRVGLDLARLHQPDLILLDLHLPDMSGREVLLQLRATAETASIPVVVVSADATQSQIQQLIRSGANAYLTKPLNIETFLDVVDSSLEKSKLPFT